jgi:hypothetical protein
MDMRDPTRPLPDRRSAPGGRPPSRLAWALAGALLLSLVWLLARFLRDTPQGADGGSGPVPATAGIGKIPATPFTDVTATAGIRFLHRNGATGDKLLPETMGGGVAFFDFDNDGNQDLLFVNSSDWPGGVPSGKQPATPALYRNDGKGGFTDITAGSGLDVSFYGMGVACGDFDNDGLADLFLTGVGGNHLFRNLGGGKFQEITTAAGVGGSPAGWSTSAAWIDYDNDGQLDLFVCNYVQWSRELDFQAGYQLPGIGRAYGPPMNFKGSFPYLYHNDGNGHFSEVSERAGMRITNPATGAPAAKSLGVAPVDLDGDGWIDLIVANDTVQNFVFHNEKNGTFKEIGALSGIAYGPYGGARGAMGIDSSRPDDASNLAVAIGNFANEMTALYISTSPLLFTDEAISRGIGPASRTLLTFGVFFFDYDLDGWLDLLTVNGHIEDQIEKTQPMQKYRQSARLFWNARSTSASGGFLPAPPEKAGAEIFKPIAGRGSAFADIDGDGDPDVVFTQVNGPPLLLRNDQTLHYHWLRFKLTGTTANRDAIGAWVKVRAGGRTLSRQVMPTRGYLSQSELPVTIGLGNAARVDEVEILWPGGATTRLGSIPVDRLHTVRQ